MSIADLDQVIEDAVKLHYSESNLPYFLANLGTFIRSKELDIPAGVRLKDYITSRFGDRFIVIQDATVPAKIAVAPLDIESSVRRQLSGDSVQKRDNDGVDETRLPFALFAAFCRRPLPGTQMYFRTAWPFRYEFRKEAPDYNYVKIEERFLPSSFAGKLAQEISASDRGEILEYVQKWADENSIDLRSLYYDRGMQSVKGTISRTVSTTRQEINALQRLVDAQEPELRRRIRIPGDIASTLMQMD